MIQIGIDLGGTATKIGLVTKNGEIAAFRTFPTPTQCTSDMIFQQIIEQCMELCAENATPLSEIESIGFGTPGFVDRENAIILYSANLHFENVSVRMPFQNAFPSIPILVENDANCAAIAEAVYGAAREYRNSITLTLGTGVGAGVIHEQQVFNGYANLAPEIGHMIIEVDGMSCSCGRKGCMEQYISATALIRQTKHAIASYPASLLAKLAAHGALSAKLPFDAAVQGDRIAQSIVDRYIHYLAVSISNIIYCYGPEIILLGGGVCNEGDRLLIPLREQVEAQLMPSSRNKTRVALAQFRNEAGVIGASALLSLQHHNLS
ncbi:ROK family protein [Agathobaculum desmolans]|uniref:ROK family protein n=1 Tax=Agathobaculum desmolans TaxID=39484 RepID=UPI00248EA458|nr:ROK family protein [Agathobaculum desmolans]